MSPSTTPTVSIAHASLPPLHTLNLLPERIVPPCIPQLLSLEYSTSKYTCHTRSGSMSSSSASSSSSSSSSATDSCPSTPSLLSPSSSRASSRSSSPTSPHRALRLVPSAAEDANALLWLPDGDGTTRASAVLLTGAAVSRHLRALERERGRARPYRVVFDRRMSAADVAAPPLRRLRACSEESC